MEYDKNSILQNLCKHLEHFVSAEVEITPDTDLINELAIDSVKLLSLVMEIRTATGVGTTWCYKQKM